MSQILPTTTAPQTLGQHLDAVLAAAGHDVTIAKTEAETLGGRAWTWLKSEWHNLLAALSAASIAAKYLGILKL